MKGKITQSLLVVVFAAFFSGCATPTKQAKWEYTTYTCGGFVETQDPNLNRLGTEGWKLVSVTYDPNAKETQCFFQRAVK